MALVMTAVEVAEEMSWLTSADIPRPRPEKVRAMVREGRFPQPIDMTEPVHLWRWSRADVERYAAGEWSLHPRPLPIDRVRRTRRPTTEARLREVAQAYNDRWTPGSPDEFAASLNVSERQMWRLLKLARDRGLLPADDRGAA
jgi:hypothetical protein